MGKPARVAFVCIGGLAGVASMRPESQDTLRNTVDEDDGNQAECTDFDDGWTDVDGFGCKAYAKKEWCVSGGINIGPKKWHSSWGKFADWAKPGFPDAHTACCACGRKAGDAVPPGKDDLQLLFKWPGKSGRNCESNYLFKLERTEVKSDRFLDECGQKCLDNKECTHLAFLATKECMGCKSYPKFSEELKKTRPNPWLAVQVPNRPVTAGNLHDPCWDQCSKEAGTHDQCTWCGEAADGKGGFEGMYCCSHNKAVVGAYSGNHPCNYAITERLPAWTVDTDYRCMVRGSQPLEAASSVEDDVVGDEGPSEGGAGPLRPIGISAALIAACLFSAFNLN